MRWKGLKDAVEPAVLKHVKPHRPKARSLVASPPHRPSRALRLRSLQRLEQAGLVGVSWAAPRNAAEPVALLSARLSVAIRERLRLARKRQRLAQVPAGVSLKALKIAAEPAARPRANKPR